MIDRLRKLRLPLDHHAIRTQIHQAATLNSSYIIMNTLATIVAGYGLLQNSIAVVIGAMIIASLLGPIMGLALSLVDGDTALLRKAVFAEIVGVGLVILIGMVIGKIHTGLPITQEILSRTKPNLLDLAIALAGGAAGAYATVSPRVSVGLVGVAISTALVPPLTVCGICLSRGLTDLAGGAIILFATNLVAIQFASSVVLFGFGFHHVTHREPGDRAYVKSLVIDVALLLGLTVFLSSQLNSIMKQHQYEDAVKRQLERGLQDIPGAYLAETRFLSQKNSDIVVAVVRVPNSITPDQTAKLQMMLPKRSDRTVELHTRSLLTKETTSKGYLHEIDPTAQPIEEITIPKTEELPTKDSNSSQTKPSESDETQGAINQPEQKSVPQPTNGLPNADN